jgi:hypothetical protein
MNQTQKAKVVEMMLSGWSAQRMAEELRLDFADVLKVCEDYVHATQARRLRKPVMTHLLWEELSEQEKLAWHAISGTEQ